MRVIAGTAKGRRLYCPKGSGIRPARDRVKESLFSILGEFVVGCNVLDLFAGTGAIGIEALSRGARSCLFVENDATAAAYIRKNLAVAGLESRGEILRANAFRSLPHLVRKGVCFDLAFVDPPYKIVEEDEDRKRLLQLLEGLAGRGIMKPPGIVVIEYRPKRAEIPDRIGGFIRFDERGYDATHLGFWHLDEDEKGEKDA